MIGVITGVARTALAQVARQFGNVRQGSCR